MDDPVLDDGLFEIGLALPNLPEAAPEPVVL